MSKYWRASKVLTGSSQTSTAAVVSAPICFKVIRKALSNSVSVIVPGAAQDLDFVDFTAETIVTAATGTAPTVATTIEGTNDFMDQSTTLTATLTAAATSVSLTARDGIAQYDYVLLYKADGTGYEWVQVTSSVATGSGAHTIVRAQCNTTALAFASGDYMFWTRSWTAVPTNNSTTTTLTSTAQASGASAAAPVISVINTQQLGMNRMPFPIIRVKTLVGASAAGTASYQTNLSGILQAGELARAK